MSLVPFISIIVLALVFYIVIKVANRNFDEVGGEGRDPQRLFTPSQREAGFRRARYRCEHIGATRCTSAAEHGDHWIPWSKGGATNMKNFVALCADHNQRKSNHMPRRKQTAAIAESRRSYMRGEVVPGDLYRM